MICISGRGSKEGSITSSLSRQAGNPENGWVSLPAQFQISNLFDRDKSKPRSVWFLSRCDLNITVKGNGKQSVMPLCKGEMGKIKMAG